MNTCKTGPCTKLFNLVILRRNLKSLLVSKQCTFAKFVSRFKSYVLFVEPQLWFSKETYNNLILLRNPVAFDHLEFFYEHQNMQNKFNIVFVSLFVFFLYSNKIMKILVQIFNKYTFPRYFVFSRLLIHITLCVLQSQEHSIACTLYVWLISVSLGQQNNTNVNSLQYI